MNIRQIITSWHLWVMVAVIGAVLILGRENLPVLLPLGIILLCPIMMMFMMHGHHDETGKKTNHH